MRQFVSKARRHCRWASTESSVSLPGAGWEVDGGLSVLRSVSGREAIDPNQFMEDLHLERSGEDGLLHVEAHLCSYLLEHIEMKQMNKYEHNTYLLNRVGCVMCRCQLQQRENLQFAPTPTLTRIIRVHLGHEISLKLLVATSE